MHVGIFEQKKMTMDKNYIKKNSWTFGSPAGHNKLYNSNLFTCLWLPLGGGGGVLRYRGGPHLHYVFRGRKGLFYTSASPQFCKRRVLFCTQVQSMGGENPLTIHEIYVDLTLSDSLSYWASEFAAAKRAEDYKI